MKGIIPKVIQIFRTSVEAGLFRIVIEPLDYEFEYDGSKPFRISTRKMLELKIENMKYPSVSYVYREI